MVAYRRFKTIENSKTESRKRSKSGRGRLREVVVYERFQYNALTENIFGVLGRWSPTGGGRIVAGVRCNVTGEYFEKGSTSEKKKFSLATED